MKIKVIKFKNYKNPNRAHYNDSGADCFAAQTVTIEPHSVVKIPTGVGVELPDGYDIVVHCKSGLPSQGIWAANAPVDAGYLGEIHAILFNTTDDFITIKTQTTKSFFLNNTSLLLSEKTTLLSLVFIFSNCLLKTSLNCISI